MTFRGEGLVKSSPFSASAHYGHCIIDIEPLPLWLGVVFENVVDRKTIPPLFATHIEAGIRNDVQENGCPFVGMGVRLVGGSWHFVDSRERDYEQAGVMALRSTYPFAARSLGWQTHLIFPAFEGQIDRPDNTEYLAVRTPENPTYHWGNFLLFDKPPKPGDLPRWEAAFAKEIGPPETIPHIAFGWDTTNGEISDVQAFTDAGYSFNDEVVLAAQATDLLRPARFNESVEIRTLNAEREWEAAIDNQIACRGGDSNDKAGYRVFKEKQFARYRRMAYEKRGNWYGAFLNGRLVGDCGLFWAGDKTLARFQGVGVHPDFRRQGICGAMLWRITHQVFTRTPDALLVIVADANSRAQAIYQSLGFQIVEKQMSLEKSA